MKILLSERDLPTPTKNPGRSPGFVSRATARHCCAVQGGAARHDATGAAAAAAGAAGAPAAAVVAAASLSNSGFDCHSTALHCTL